MALPFSGDSKWSLRVEVQQDLPEPCPTSPLLLGFIHFETGTLLGSFMSGPRLARIIAAVFMATDEDLSLPNCGICHAIRRIPPHVHSMFQRPLQWTRNNQGSTAASSTKAMFAVVLGHFERFQGSTTASAQCSFFHADGQVRDVFSNQLRDHCTRTIDGITGSLLYK